MASNRSRTQVSCSLLLRSAGWWCGAATWATGKVALTVPGGAVSMKTCAAVLPCAVRATTAVSSAVASSRAERKPAAVASRAQPLSARGGFLGQSLPRVQNKGACATASRGPRTVRAAQAAEQATETKTATLTARIHYHRDDEEYEGWGLHVWGDVVTPTSWDGALQPTGQDAFGPYFDVPLMENADSFGFLVHKGEDKDCQGELKIGDSQEYWLVMGGGKVWQQEPDLSALPKGDLHKAQALWISRNVIVVPGKNRTPDGFFKEYTLHSCYYSNMDIVGEGITNSERKVELRVSDTGIPSKLLAKWPHLKDYTALTFTPTDGDVEDLVKCQLALGVADRNGKPLDATGVQLAGILDDVFKYDGQLGIICNDTNVTLAVWAPTAQALAVQFFDKPSGGEPMETVKMQRNGGVWFAVGPTTWHNRYFKYEVKVFCPWTNKVETSYATDPYSRSLSANGERTHILNINDPSTFPEGWEEINSVKPPFTRPNDMAIYELHIRDFSAMDESLDPNLRGTYLAFAAEDSSGVNHLRRLAQHGITHVHLLPTFDFATVNENRSMWKAPENDLSQFGPDSEEQQAAVATIAHDDGYNWGYDPAHYGVPEGSYATDPNGLPRILEFRKMILALNKMGWRVIMDVVYNHLSSSGPHGDYSTFDKLVPGYYVRRNLDGYIENSTCMNNTASEHYMFDRFIKDDLLHWAKDYKIDGFRFDLMGHLMKSTMVEAKERLQSLTIEGDGVDGRSIYLYGEGWDFGEVANNQRGVNAAQLNLPGTGIGSFNDRIREASTGGTPFGDIREQGFCTGLSLQNNGFDQGGAEHEARKLAYQTDWIRAGLAGNLRDYVIVNCDGSELTCWDVKVGGGAPCGYAGSPEETVNYVSAHDNETLFDVIMLKVPLEVTLEERVRMNWLATSIIALSQGVPFFHAGDEVLRSKSLDRDSYNSGDWFNKLDFSYEANNFAVGLPPKEKNFNSWDRMRKLLSNPDLKPRREHIEATVDNMCEMLAIRMSSPLFRLPTAPAIQARVTFQNSGPAAVPGLIVMSIIDAKFDNGAITVPGRTTAVFVKLRENQQ
eukprot:jgi/Chlat1/2695/Chrsp180S02860